MPNLLKIMKNSDTITIGTRSSDLALWQTQWVADELRKLYPHISVDITKIKTTGDKILDAPLSKIGDKGLFTKELEIALLDHRVDLAVHSLKDVPTVVPEGLTLGAVCKREDVRDVFVVHPQKKYKNLSEVPNGGTIATGSLRRKCQLLQRRPDLAIADIRGNLATRTQKLKESDWDGMLLAKAGLTRLGWSSMITEVLEPTFILPAVGQGALAIEIRANDGDLARLLQPLNHEHTMQATAAERGLLRELEGGCQIPIGTYGRIEKDILKLDALVGSIDGRRVVTGYIDGSPSSAEELGITLAKELLGKGAKEILDEIRLASDS